MSYMNDMYSPVEETSSSPAKHKEEGEKRRALDEEDRHIILQE